MTEVEEMFRSPLAKRTRELNDRLKVAVREEQNRDLYPDEFCNCCQLPKGKCNCNGGCE